VVQVIDCYQVRVAGGGKIIIARPIIRPGRDKVSGGSVQDDPVGSTSGDDGDEGAGQMALARPGWAVKEERVQPEGRPAGTDRVRNAIDGGPRQPVLRECNPASEGLHAA
jgi:hypothetical protein